MSERFNVVGSGASQRIEYTSLEAKREAELELDQLNLLLERDLKIVEADGKEESGWRLSSTSVFKKPLSGTAVWSESYYVSVSRNKDPNEPWSETMIPRGGRDVKEIPVKDLIKWNE